MQPSTIIINNDSGGGSGSSGGILGGLIPSRVWGIVGILLILGVLFVIYSGVQYYGNFVEDNCPDANDIFDVGFCAVESNPIADDTGQSGTSALVSSIFWASPWGFLGSAIGIRTDGKDVGERISNNATRVGNGFYTFFKRLTGR